MFAYVAALSGRIGDDAALAFVNLLIVSPSPRAVREHVFSLSRLARQAIAGIGANVNEKSRPLADFSLTLVPRRGLEPPRLAALVPETSASTNSAIWAGRRIIANGFGLAKPFFGLLLEAGENGKGQCSSVADACLTVTAPTQKNAWATKKPLPRAAFPSNWCPEEDSNLHASQR